MSEAAAKAFITDPAGSTSAQDVRDSIGVIYTDMGAVLDAIPDDFRYMLARQPGETPNADDRFFTTGDAPGGTSVVPTGTLTVPATIQGNRLGLSATGQSADDIAGYVWPLTASGPPITLESVSAYRGMGTLHFHVPLLFSDGTANTSNLSGIAEWNASGKYLAGTFTAAVGGADSVGVPSFPTVYPYVYRRLIWKSANTWKVGWSLDRYHWVYTGDLSRTMTPTHYGYGLTTYGQAGHALGSLFSLRVDEADLST